MGRKRGRSFLLRFVVIVLFSFMIGIAVYQGILKEQDVVAEEGMIGPDFTLLDINGVKHHTSDYKDQGVLLNFWATYCPPCEKEMPELESAFQEYNDQGITIIGINVGEPAIIVNRFLSNKDISFPILLDSKEDVYKRYGVHMLPTTFVMNAEGEIVQKISGELTERKINEAIKLVKP